MVIIDLDSNISLTEVFRIIESGEMVRLMRGEHFVALVTPAAAINEALWDSCNWDDKTWLTAAANASAQALVDEAHLHHLAELGVKQLAEALPPHEFDEWDKSNRTA